jgi:hypothetical protein
MLVVLLYNAGMKEIEYIHPVQPLVVVCGFNNIQIW